MTYLHVIRTIIFNHVKQLYYLFFNLQLHIHDIIIQSIFFFFFVEYFPEDSR